ncbi:hypothetical protein [Leifsonia sp. NPDC080035]|uniref:DUF6993 domain-containing protein n=1 Tax=Leifsonia sp. NPDC080035 TaxID=3143936 RepID=A0AAU7G8R4_9MICO
MTPPSQRRSLGARGAVRAVATVIVVASGIALAGCSSPAAPRPTATATATATSTPTASAAPAPALVIGGTAQQNKPFFDRVNRATLAANPNAHGRDFIDALVAAGFVKKDMQVTPDTTTIGLKANSIQFSVKLGSTCLIGQNGADAGGYSSMVTPVLATGTCLIGDTRPIDW